MTPSFHNAAYRENLDPNICATATVDPLPGVKSRALYLSPKTITSGVHRPHLKARRLNVPTPPQPAATTPSHHAKAMYSLGKAQALLLCDNTLSKPTGVLTLKVTQNQYIKLRDLRMQPATNTKITAQNWLSFGSSSTVHINRKDFNREMEQHKQPTKFGPYSQLADSAHALLKNAQEPAIEIATQDDDADDTLTTRMDDAGNIVCITRKLLGKGSSKKVFEDTCRATGKKTAWAKLKRKYSEDKDSIDELISESTMVSNLMALGVPHLVSTRLTHGQNLQKVRLEMFLADGGDFSTFVTEGSPATPEHRTLRVKYLRQIAEALAAMHAAGFSHNDVKNENCFIDKTQQVAYLGDLGLAAHIGTRETLCGTHPAPEFSSTKKTGVKARCSTQNDRWAFGLVIYEMAHGRNPYKMAWDDGKESILSGAKKIQDSLSSSQDPLDIATCRLLRQVPKRRSTMDQIVAILAHS